MPINKNRMLRLRILDQCLRRQNFTFKQLVEEVNDRLRELHEVEISGRTIREDIRFMKDSFNAPIDKRPYVGKKCIYYYTHPKFSIFNNELSDEEVTKLRETIEILGRFSCLPGKEWLEKVISSLEYRFGVDQSNEKYVSFDQNEKLLGLRHLSSIIDATIKHQPLLLEYRSFGGTIKSVTIHPYHVKEYNNRWFLFGLEVTDNGNYITNRALDRIISFANSNVEFIPNRDTDFNSYFNDIIGVSIDENSELVDVILKFDEKRFPYVLSKPLHHSQSVIPGQNHTVKIRVKPNKELESQILFFGSQVEVLEPECLRKSIADNIAESYKKYFDTNN